MRRKRIMIIGAGGSGKSTLAAWLEGKGAARRRTPVIVYGERTMEAPGAYLECPWMHCHLIAAAQDASCVLMLADPAGARGKRIYPPGFSRVFGPPVIGVVTKYDLENGRAEECEAELRQAGITGPVFRVSIHDGQSLRALEYALAACAAGNEHTGKGGN